MLVCGGLRARLPKGVGGGGGSHAVSLVNFLSLHFTSHQRDHLIRWLELAT